MTTDERHAQAVARYDQLESQRADEFDALPPLSRLVVKSLIDDFKASPQPLMRMVGLLAGFAHARLRIVSAGKNLAELGQKKGDAQ